MNSQEHNTEHNDTICGISWDTAKKDVVVLKQLLDAVNEETYGEEQAVMALLPETVEYSELRQHLLCIDDIETACRLVDDLRSFSKIQSKRPTPSNVTVWSYVITTIASDVKADVLSGNSSYQEDELTDAIDDRIDLLDLSKEFSAYASRKPKDRERYAESPNGSYSQCLTEVPVDVRREILELVSSMDVGENASLLSEASEEDLERLVAIVRHFLSRGLPFTQYTEEVFNLTEDDICYLFTARDASVLSEEERQVRGAIQDEIENIERIDDDDIEAYDAAISFIRPRVVVLLRLLAMSNDKSEEKSWHKRLATILSISEAKLLSMDRKDFYQVPNYELAPDLFADDTRRAQEEEGEEIESSDNAAATSSYKLVEIDLDAEQWASEIPEDVRTIIKEVSADSRRLLHVCHSLFLHSPNPHASYLRRAIANNNRYLFDLIDAMLPKGVVNPFGRRGYRNVFEAIDADATDQDFGYDDITGEDFTATVALSGTSDKIEIMRRRIEDGKPLHHPDDRIVYSDIDEDE